MPSTVTLSWIDTPITHLRDFTSDLHRSMILKMDLVQAFIQILLEPADFPKTVFNHIPQPVRVCTHVLLDTACDQTCKNLSTLYTYLNDLLVASHSFVEHLQHLQ